MRLLIVAQTASAHTPKWARAFAARGDDVLVVSETPNAIEAPAFSGAAARRPGTLKVEVFPSSGAWWSRLPREKWGGGWQRWLAGYFDWRRIVRDFRPDIIHVHFLTADFRNRFYYAHRALRGANGDSAPRIVVSSWGSDVVFDEAPPPRVAAHLSALLGAADRVTATTEFLAAETRRFLPPGQADQPIDVIGFGVDTELFHPAEAGRPARASGPLRLGWAKGLERMYGTEELLAAFVRLREGFPELELWIAGDGSEKASLQQRFAAAGVAESVHFLGRLAPAEVAAMLQQVDLLLMPSICRESFGVAALEASASGVPVVATRHGGIPEAVIDGETGLLVPPRDPLALAEATASLLTNPGRRQAMSLAGRDFVTQRFPWARSVESMAAVYAELLSTR